MTIPQRTAHRGRAIALLIAVALLGLSFLLSLGFGSRPVSPSELWGAVSGTSSTEIRLLIVEQRLPRTLVGLTVGLALGAAGALMQGHTRNPLADPGILGISAGAAFAVVLGTTVFGATGVHAMTWAALVGAALTTVAVGLVASFGSRRVSPLTLIVVGAAISAVLSSLTTALVLRSAITLDAMRFWTVGGLAGRDMEIFWSTAPFILVGLLLALLNAPQINLLNLGDATAATMGVHVGGARTLGVLGIALLMGGATAAAGPLAFIGLVVPHLVRAISGPDYRWLLPLSACVGASFLLLADVLGRVLSRPGEIQAGIILALLGAPFFLLLLWRRRSWSL